MEVFAALFQRAVLVLAVTVLAAICAAGVCLGLRNTGFFRRARWLLHAFLHPSSAVGWLCVVPLALVLIGMGSEKFGGGGGTNDPPPRLSAPRRVLRQFLDNAVTSDDVVRGYRIAESSGTDGILGMPEGATTNEPLRRRGGFDWAFRVAPDGWRFPYRDGFLDGVTVVARGEVRPDVGTLYFPMPITNGVSLLPEVKWHLLPAGEASVFSYAVTEDGSLLLDWRNALVNRDPNCPTNLQMELFRDGSFAWRTDGGSRFYLPVFPFDWDGDGLENSVDPDPLVANPVDAHGTNPEWHGIVCSNVFENIGGTVCFRESINSNAYYFAEVVAEEGPAPVRFDADRDSRLGSPVVVALPGETNRVPLLIGVEYAVTSTVPISVSVPDSMYAVVTTNGLRSATVRWPLEFAFEEGIGASNRTYTVSVGPYDPGGEFIWGGAQQGGGAMLMSASPNPSCACYTALGNTVTYSCSPTCGCGGDCAATGSYCFESAMFSVTGGVCRCGFDDPPPPEEPHHDDLDGPGFSIEFSKSAVIFEDAYEDSPGVTKPKRSTRVRLTVSAYGGPNGGTFLLTHQNLDKLDVVADGPIQLPSSKTLAPGEGFYTTCVYEAEEASDTANDVYVQGYFIEDNTHERYDGKGELTIVRIEITPETVLPQNPVLHRHVFGLREKATCRYYPSSANVGLAESDRKIYIDDDNDFLCPWTNGEYTVFATLEDARLGTPIRVYSPTVECRSARWREELVGEVGTAGNVGMSLALYLQPSSVSFSYIWLQEIPEYVAIPPSGYFALTNVLPLTHDESAGAGRWRQPWPRNGGNYWTDDAVQMPGVCPTLEGTNPPSWAEGTARWLIPVGWGDGITLIDRMQPNPTTQVYHMTEDGTLSISKYLHTIMRSIDGKVWLDGSRVNAWWSGRF